MLSIRCPAFWFLSFVSFPLLAADWPQLLGPTSDAVYNGPALAEQWPKQGPRVAWSVEIGEGYSSPVVSEGRLVIAHRLETNLVVHCLDAKTGAKQWTFQHAMKFQDGAFFDSGPRPTPAIKNARVFIHNTDGYLVCLDFKSGEKIWSRHPKTEFKSSATWHGMVSSPLVTDKAVILPIGATNAGIVAFSVETGKTLWQVFDDKASASSPVLAKLDGKAQLLVVTRKALRSLDSETGAEFWHLDTGRQSTGDVYAARSRVGEQRPDAALRRTRDGQVDLGAAEVRFGNDREVWR